MEESKREKEGGKKTEKWLSWCRERRIKEKQERETETERERSKEVAALGECSMSTVTQHMEPTLSSSSTYKANVRSNGALP